MDTVPNQRTVCVHREKAKSDFLGIKNENWMYASRDLGAHALRLYLYLASNADGYKFALSPADIRQRVGIPSSTYRDQFQKLVDKGYLVSNSGNGYDFYELPQTRVPIEVKEKPAPHVFDDENETADVSPVAAPVPDKTTENREIYNSQIPTDKETNISAPEVVEVRIPVPEATGRNRPEHRPTPKPFQDFVF